MFFPCETGYCELWTKFTQKLDVIMLWPQTSNRQNTVDIWKDWGGAGSVFSCGTVQAVVESRQSYACIAGKYIAFFLLLSALGFCLYPQLERRQEKNKRLPKFQYSLHLLLHMYLMLGGQTKMNREMELENLHFQKETFIQILWGNW